MEGSALKSADWEDTQDSALVQKKRGARPEFF
jgi:hypothetical protein